jgi:hypothetical protein
MPIRPAGVLLALVSLLVTACASTDPGRPTADEQVMPADFAGTVEYANGTVAPPYHYEWSVEFDASAAVVRWRPGYDEKIEPWQETVEITAEQREQLYGRLHELGVFDMAEAVDDGMVGGPAGGVQLTAGGRVYDPGTLGLSEDGADTLEDVAAAARELVPADVWAALQDKQDAWSAEQK